MKKAIYFLIAVLSLYLGKSNALAYHKNYRDTALSKVGVFNVKSYGAKGDGTTNDGPSIQRAIDTAASKGGGIVQFPAGRYRLTASLIPKSNIILQGSGLGAVLMATTSFTAAIGQPTSALSNFTIQSLTFEGGVINEGVFPRRNRNYTSSFSSAIIMTGDRITGGSYPRIENISIQNCSFLKIRSLPILFQGVSNKSLVTNSFFDNCLDPGFTWCESVQFIANNVIRGADNGVSVSRGCKDVVVANNVFENIAYWGVWCAGYNVEPGPETFSITGNVIKRCGYGGIALSQGPRYGTITGNTIDTVFNGPTDEPSKVQGRGIYLTPYSTAPTHDVSQIIISNNLLRHIARGGISLSSASDVLITGNSFINIGATDTLSTKVNYNCAIYTDDTGLPGAGLNRIGIVGNSFVDNRATVYSNYAYSPAIKTSTNSYQKANTMFGYRQPLDEKLTVGGNNDNDQSISINAKAGVLRELLFQTAGVRRWDFRTNNVAESGAQVGSDFSIIRRNDDGTVAGTPFTIIRSDGSLKLAESAGKLGFFGVTTISKYSAIPNTTGASLADLEIEVNKLKALIRAYGLMTP